MSAVIILAGAPRVPLDAVRFLTVNASGATAANLARSLRSKDIAVTIIASPDACPCESDALRYSSRDDLDALIQAQLQQYPDAVVVSSAAINDYQLVCVESVASGVQRCLNPEEKISSGADEVVLRLRPAPKLIDQLPAWGHTGPLVAFKYEDASTVIASAQNLMRRVNAALVVANSLCGEVQCLVGCEGVTRFDSRADLMTALAQRVAGLKDAVTQLR